MPSADAPDRADHSRLRRRFLGAVAAGALGLVALRPLFGGRWLLGAAPVGLYLAVYAGSNLTANRAPGAARARSTLGAANAITLFRGWLLAVLAGAPLGSAPNRWVPVALFCVAVSLDAVDGAVARRTRETVLGARLDAAVDALAVLVGGVVAVGGGALPAWYLVAGGVWYAYAGSLWLRKRAGEPTYELPPSRVRGPIGIAQFLVVAAGLAPGIGGRPLAAVAGVALAVLLASFVRDWAAATGRLGRDDPPIAPE
ncbi:CDP-alcohol phosphatidyltransferase family protein [Halorubrum sp. PV6]|uniref:CDP-alcohol phosphatidyltransferase family protein n=1 Tax=Halorubrum sp. PV6 TaxID=634157 RepID=UPI000F85719B|nr:CDP-alcohol phosphatidyltransferase family protein [Halorubrum sp. PV6]AZQ14426.1 CDP-diacylglycerol--glycerol-3-phosphate 3-phosphatidyltransferase [Halorubrum sp. PV6]